MNLNRRDAVSTLTRFESRWAFHRKIGQQIQENILNNPPFRLPSTLPLMRKKKAPAKAGKALKTPKGTSKGTPKGLPVPAPPPVEKTIPNPMEVYLSTLLSQGGKRVAVLDFLGSLCPITLGHVQSVVEAHEILTGKATPLGDTAFQVFDGCVALITVNDDSHVSRKLASKGEAAMSRSDRLKLCELATAEYPWIHSDVDFPLACSPSCARGPPRAASPRAVSPRALTEQERVRRCVRQVLPTMRHHHERRLVLVIRARNRLDRLSARDCVEAVESFVQQQQPRRREQACRELDLAQLASREDVQRPMACLEQAVPIEQTAIGRTQWHWVRTSGALGHSTVALGGTQGRSEALGGTQWRQSVALA